MCTFRCNTLTLDFAADSITSLITVVPNSVVLVQQTLQVTFALHFGASSVVAVATRLYFSNLVCAYSHWLLCCQTKFFFRFMKPEFSRYSTATRLLTMSWLGALV